MTGWSPDYLDVYRRRMVLVELARDPGKASLLVLRYKNNPVDFINDWVTTYDPRLAGKKDDAGNDLLQYMPMVLFKRQEEFIQFLRECLTEKQSGLVEKSRDVGASWLCCAFAVWLLLFHPGSAVGFGSRVVDDVDKLGDPDSLFQKIRIILNKLPTFLLPDKPMKSGYMKIINPSNGSMITGGSGDNIGRGGRSSIFFKDESAHYERPEIIEAALSANTDVQIDISSVNGNGNVFYRRRMAGELWAPGEKIPRGKTRVFIFDWRDNPMKDQAWYDEKRAKWDADGMLHVFAQEVDRDYSASIAGVVIPAKWVRAAIDAHIALGFEPSGEKVSALDVADEGGDKNGFLGRHGVVLLDAEHWGEGDTGKTANRAVDMCRDNGYFELHYDAIGVGSGVKAETNRLAEAEQLPKDLQIFPWVASASPMQPDDNLLPGDDRSPKNGDFFVNLKSQGWWRTRIRFEKTYKMRTQGIIYPHDELISISSKINNLRQLEQELSQVVYKKRPSDGKIVIDKKPPGTKSPNLADGVVICYNPNRQFTSFDVL